MLKEEFEKFDFEVSDAELKMLCGYYGHCHNLSEKEFCEDWVINGKDSKIVADMKLSLDFYQSALIEKREALIKLRSRLIGFFELMLDMVKNYTIGA